MSYYWIARAKRGVSFPCSISIFIIFFSSSSKSATKLSHTHTHTHLDWDYLQKEVPTSVIFFNPHTISTHVIGNCQTVMTALENQKKTYAVNRIFLCPRAEQQQQKKAKILQKTRLERTA